MYIPIGFAIFWLLVVVVLWAAFVTTVIQTRIEKKRRSRNTVGYSWHWEAVRREMEKRRARHDWEAMRRERENIERTRALFAYDPMFFVRWKRDRILQANEIMEFKHAMNRQYGILHLSPLDFDDISEIQQYMYNDVLNIRLAASRYAQYYDGLDSSRYSYQTMLANLNAMTSERNTWKSRWNEAVRTAEAKEREASRIAEFRERNLRDSYEKAFEQFVQFTAEPKPYYIRESEIKACKRCSKTECTSRVKGGEFDLASVDFVKDN